jgi:dsDNA-binding SOS-regulon protein
MATPKSVLSKTLQSITLSKIRELDSRHKSYEDRKRGFLSKADAAADGRDRLASLLEAVKELSPAASKDANLENIQRWLDQSRYDVSIPISKLDSFSRQLRAKLDIQSRKLDMAHLYSRLLTGRPPLPPHRVPRALF